MLYKEKVNTEKNKTTENIVILKLEFECQQKN